MEHVHYDREPVGKLERRSGQFYLILVLWLHHQTEQLSERLTLTINSANAVSSAMATRCDIVNPVLIR